nr:MAG TPA: hypothetical protein [Caudoviricetes sp.]
MNRYRVTLKLDDEKTNVMVHANNSDIAKNIVIDMMHCSLNEILKVLEIDNTTHYTLRELEFKQFKDTVASMKLNEFSEFIMTMYTTYNFLRALEDMEVDQVEYLQDMPESKHVSMTSKKLADFFRKNFSMDIE